ncbi:MAG: hypothetical protein OEW69_10225 [Nitrospirota bacterium]|nr:hypothetical protein [Nitrospirota bacterium]MDH5661419.1 hypothetical protein [Elusimicrobiota bacterium]
MRFSDLKKKLPSLRVGVLVIAAFALLGSMMLPSISEKMGLDEGLCAGYDYYVDECDTDYRNDLQDQMYDECVAEAEATYNSLSRNTSTNCRLENLKDDAGYEKCVANAEKWIAEWYEEALEDCEYQYKRD